MVSAQVASNLALQISHPLMQKLCLIKEVWVPFPILACFYSRGVLSAEEKDTQLEM